MDNLKLKPGIKHRPSYTLSNATRFIGCFEEALKLKSNIKIPTKNSGLSLSTLRHRAAEALLFICNEFSVEFFPKTPFKKEDFIQLRGMIQFSFTTAQDGVLIEFKKSKSHLKTELTSEEKEKEKQIKPV